MQAAQQQQQLPTQQQRPLSANPILDIDDESIGYIGTIGERNVLVDLKPHLQIKNIEAISKLDSFQSLQNKIYFF